MFKEKDARDLITAHKRKFAEYALHHRGKANDLSSTIDYRNQAAVKMKVNEALADKAADMLEQPSYHELAMRTAAGIEVFHYPVLPDSTISSGEDATDAAFCADVIDYLNAVARLDRWKSRLFYNKDKIVVENAICTTIHENWSLGNIPNPQVIHAILGIATEGGELVEDLVKLANPIGVGESGPIVDNIKRETGDVDWYQELLARAMRYSTDDAREINIARLAKRYPERFSEEAAIARADEGIPTVKVDRHTSSKEVVITCPYCQKPHYHGAQYVPGHRVAHCNDPSIDNGKGYYITE